MDLQDTVGGSMFRRDVILSIQKVDALRYHLQDQVSIYGEQSLVNLVNQKGHEQPVKDAYERIFNQVCYS